MEKFGVKIKGIVKHQDRFLIVNKWYDDRIEEPYQWEFFDTLIEDSESPETACIRYIQDSTGQNVRHTSIPYTWLYQLGDTRYVGIAFLCELADEIIILSEDLHDYKWVTAEEVENYVQNKSMLRDMKKAGVL